MTTSTKEPADRLHPVFRAIGHAGRRHLLTRLADDGGRTLGELCEGLPMTRQAVSQHLDLLQAAGLVVTRWHGREKLHYLNPTPLCEIHDRWLAPLITRAAQALAALRSALEERPEARSADSDMPHRSVRHGVGA